MGHILRSSEVKLEGRCEVGRIVPEAAGGQEGPASGPERVQVVERHDEYAVLEVTCSCGSTFYVRCELG